MSDLLPSSPAPFRPYDVDPAALLGRLAPHEADDVAQLIRERDHLFVLYEALLEVDQAPSLEARLQVLVNAIRKIGFGRVTITLRDNELHPTLIVTAGLTSEEERELRAAPTGGDVWRRRLPLLERFRVGNSFYLDGRDPWVAREFRGAIASAMAPGDDPTWSPQDTLLVPLRGREGRLIATLSLDEPADRRRPTLARVRTVELFGQQVANAIEQAELVAIAERRAGRLQRLQEVGAMLARSLDEREIVREIARQVARIVPLEGIVIANPDVEEGRTRTALRLVHGVERPRMPTRLEHGAIGEVARRGRPVRDNDYDPARSPLAAADDVVGDGGPAGSVLAVPMLAGIQLVGVIAVHTPRPGAYTSEDEEVLLTIGAQAATAITNARLYAESQRERRQSEALADVARAVGESLRLGEVLHLILRHVTALLRGEGADVMLRKEDYLHVVAGVGCAEPLAGMLIPVNASLSGRALREGRYFIVNDAASDPETWRPTRNIINVRKTLLVPLITARGAIGVISVINRPADFTDEDALVLQRLADQVAVAIVNAGLYEEVAEATREWKVAFDAIASGMMIVDEEGRVARANARALQLAGAAPGVPLVGRDFHDALLQERHDASDECPVEHALTTYQAARASMRSAARGRIFDVLASPHPNGGAVVTFDDVTEQHALAERYRRVVETASDGIVITDPERRIAFCNPAAQALLGGGPELVGRPVGEFVPPDLAAEVRRAEELAFAGEAQRYETTIVRADGERRLVAVSTAPLREVGEITGVVASLRDVTIERRARDAVVQSESRYRNLFEHASDAIYTLDARGCFTSVNAATCRLTGQERAELLGRSIVPWLEPEEVDAVRAQFKRALAGDPSHYECRMVRHSGEKRLLSVTNTPIRHGEQVIGILGIARDVTVERERAAALERSEARYTRLVESASDAIFTVDEEGCFTSVNRALEESTGTPRTALLGSHFTEVIDPRDRARAWDTFVRTLDGGRQRSEFRYLAHDGTSRSASIITAPIVERGHVVGGLGVVRDITDEKRLLEQLVQQEKLAAIGTLVSGVAHELNNPLASVTAFAQMLLAAPALPDDLRGAVDAVLGEGRRAAKIVSNLLTFARQHAPERTMVDLNEVLHDTLALRRHALMMQGIELEEALDPTLPATWADPFQLQQVLLNLLVNAEQAVADREGGRRVRVATCHRDAMLEVTIQDNGEGIAADDLGRIFNPFYTTKPVGKGTGLGLSISDGIVREHGGRIRVESSPGAGAAFILELPLGAVPDEPLRAGAPRDGSAPA